MQCNSITRYGEPLFLGIQEKAQEGYGEPLCPGIQKKAQEGY